VSALSLGRDLLESNFCPHQAKRWCRYAGDFPVYTPIV
jgi:hypothetical protein